MTVTLQTDILSISCEIALSRMLHNLNNDKVNISWGNGLVPSGNEPLFEPMLTKFS